MKKTISLVLVLSAGAAAAATTIRIDAEKIRAEVPKTLYGSGMEDVNHEIYGGLDAQRLYDESFEEQEIEPTAGCRIQPKPGFVCGRQWTVESAADGRVTADRREPHLGAVAVALEPGGGRAAVVNAGLNGWGIPARTGRRLQGHFFAKGAVGKLFVSLRTRDGRGASETVALSLRPTNEWQRVDFVLNPTVTDPAASFVLGAEAGGRVLVDDAYLADEPANEFGRLGCREDIVDGFRAEGLTFLRWGGSMANSWGYLWKNMKDDRRPYDGYWFRTSSTGFLYREFVRMADRMKLPFAFSIYAYEQIEKVVEIAEWLRPFKGDVYVQIGNEECSNFTPTCGECSIGDCRRYCASLRQIVTEMRRVNPRLKFVSGIYYNQNHQDVMDEGFRLTDGYVDYWDIHLSVYDTNVVQAVEGTRRKFGCFRDMIRRLNPQTTMKAAVFEENGREHGLRRALVHAGVLGVCREQGDFLLTSCPANALQPYLQNDNGWDQGQIFFTPDKVWLQPCAWAQQMASSNHRELLVEGTSSDAQVIVSATRSRDGSSLVVHLVNASTEPRPIAWTFADAAPWQLAKATVLTGDGPLANNLPECPARVAPRDDTESLRRTATLKPYSYTVVEFVRPKLLSEEPVHVARAPDDRTLPALVPFAPGEVTVGGEFGHRMKLALDKMLVHTDIENTFAKHFRVRQAKPSVKGGFAGYGMFLDALVKAAAHGIGGAETVAAKTRLLAEIAATQTSDGNISIFAGEPGFWDNHEQAYLIQAFVRDGMWFGNRSSLETARRIADFLIARKAPMTLGTETAFALLLRETKDPRYAAWLKSSCLIAAPIEEYDHKLGVNGVAHVYTYLARALGQLDYADAIAATGADRAALTEATEKAFRRVQGPYLSISGSLTGTPDWGELWDATQAGLGKWGETCATAYLMRLAAKRAERDASTYYGDLIERATYNAFFSAQSEDGIHYAYWTAFNERSPWYDRDTYCCPNNFRREVFELPDMVFFRTPEGDLVVNLYSDAELKSDATRVTMKTVYPEGGHVALDVKTPGGKLYLRIPGWCARARVSVDGGTPAEAVRGWYEVAADFASPRRVEIDFEMPIRVVKGVRAQEGRVAVCRGPLVYGFAPDLNKATKYASGTWAIDLAKPIVWDETAKAPVATFVRRTQERRAETSPLARYSSEKRTQTFLDCVNGSFSW